MTFVNNFMKTLSIPIGALAQWLETEHQVPVSSTIEKWNELTGMKVTIDENSTGCEEVVDQTIVIGSKKPVTADTTTLNGTMLDPLLCQHVFIAGQRKGQQCCTKPKGGKDRCSAHKLKIPRTNPLLSDGSEGEKNKSKIRKVPKSKEIVPSDSESDSDIEKVPLPPKKKIEKKVPAFHSSCSEDEFSEPARKVPLPKKKPDPVIDSEDEFSEPARKVPLPKKKIEKKATLSDSEDAPEQ
jgi:hypothetical protein